MIEIFDHLTPFAQKASYRWGNVLNGSGGHVVSVKVHSKNSDLVFVQLFNWVPDFEANPYGIAGMALYPAHEKIIFDSAGKYIENNPHGVFKSIDGGATCLIKQYHCSHLLFLQGGFL